MIRQANIQDANLISELSSRTFYETFAEVNTKGDMDKYLNEKFNLNVINEELTNSKAIFFIAYVNDEAVGYSKLKENKTPDELKNNKALEIERIYVYKKFQDQKLGAALMQQNLEFAKQNDFNLIWLGVWELNPKAISFYKRWGFEVFGKHVFVLGNDTQNDLLMKKKI